ncbi:MAG: RNA-directed DNA polymerase [Verrucomicrobia bacterium]|nr:RNA-directed DNA polymerase [Verrucomicrobiota bacterium]
MPADSPIQAHRASTRDLARALKPLDVYRWLLEYGYFPEAYVLPPCFRVAKKPEKLLRYYDPNKNFKGLKETECVRVHFPKTQLTDRTFGIIEPKIHNDIAYHITRNWKAMVDAMIPPESIVSSYSFPVPVSQRKPGRMGELRSGRMIYEFISMTDDDLATVAYKFTHIVKADIKNFYPSVYTHSLAWAIHGKRSIRYGGKGKNRRSQKFVGNRLDRLFQYANDGCTNGLPIGPVVSDIAAEIIASAVDCIISSELKKADIECEAARFKDDYRILVSSEAKAKKVIKILQSSLKEFNLELSDEKTTISALPDGLFRPWVSRYHLVNPKKRKRFTWKQFRELYLAVVEIDRIHPNTGVIDRFLADITTRKGELKITVGPYNLEKVISMLLMLGTLRIKAFPKIMASLEQVIRTDSGNALTASLVSHLEAYLQTLSADEGRNKYLISWIGYFLASNDLLKFLKVKPKFKDLIANSSMTGRGKLFDDAPDFKLIEGVKAAGKRVSLFEHLDVFNPPKHLD